jgi:hypothetical protein
VPLRVNKGDADGNLERRTCGWFHAERGRLVACR